jgi:cytochrome c-type biogenesis protein CcmH/NrfG
MTTDWGSALAILAAGLILGTLVFFMARCRKATAATKRSELEMRRDALVQQLRELGNDATDDDRAPLEKETAEVLRDLDRLPAAAASDPPQPAPRPRTATTGFVWGVVCTLAAGGVVYYASTFTQDDTNVDAQIVQAKDAFARNDLMAAFEKTNAVLAKNPDEPRALTYNAVVRLSMGEVDKASSMLERATQRDPKLLDAWVALAQARLQAGQQKKAAEAIDAAIAQRPEEEKRLRDVFATMQKKEPAAAEALPPNHPPLPTAEPAHAMPSAGASQPIHITLSLDPAMPSRGGVIYVIARGGEAGHPVAVRRIDTNAFPVTLDLGLADSMMGAALPDKVRIEARLDGDGDAGTNDPADLHAFADGVSAGASVELKLVRAN